MHTEVPGRGSADRVLLLTEKASAICAETRTGGQRGNLFYPLAVLTHTDGSEVIITLQDFIKFTTQAQWTLRAVSEL